MAYVIGILLTLLSVVVLAYPFLKARRAALEAKETAAVEELVRARQTIFDEMKRLRLDLDVNNITPEEYQQRTASLRRDAAVNLRREEKLRSIDSKYEAETLKELDRHVEESIRLFRHSKQHKNGAVSCLECGNLLELAEQSCPECGAMIAHGSQSPGEETN